LRIDVPPLRERRQDIPCLAANMLDRFKGLSTPPVTSICPDAMRALLDNDWPDNVAGLERCLKSAVARAAGSVIRLQFLPPSVTARVLAPRTPENGLIDVNRPLGAVAEELVERLERSYLIDVLERYHGQIAGASRHSGLSRRGVTDKMHRYGLSKAQFQDRYLFEDMKISK